MRLKDLSVGDIVAVGKPNELGTRWGASKAIVLATSGYELRRRTSWDTRIAENSRATGFVAVAICRPRQGVEHWEPAVLRPQKVLATWSDHQVAIVRNDQRRTEVARREAEAKAAREELLPKVKALLAEGGCPDLYVSVHDARVTLSFTQFLAIGEALKARGEVLA